MRSFGVAVAFFLVFVPAGFSTKGSSEAVRLDKAAAVIDEIMTAPEKGIPHDLLTKAVCVGVIPSSKKVALGLGGSFGRGALVCRWRGSGPWGPPSMFTVGGPNIGFQLGGQATDFVLLVMNRTGAQRLLQSHAKLGANASVAGGPVGRTAEAATDLQLRAEILTYSRSRGLFAGVSLEGQVIKQDHDANARLYGHEVEPNDVLFGGAIGIPGPARPLIAVLTKYSPPVGRKVVRK